MLCSLKLAVFVVGGIALACGAATFVEAIYDTPTSLYYVYRATWFYVLLGLFGTNILCVALSRWPWKKHHAPFLIAHLGILILLFGSFVTFRHGLDASMRVGEGELSHLVETTVPMLSMTEGGRARQVVVPWTPPIARFRPIEIPEFGVTVEEFMTHADAKTSFVAAADGATGSPALRIEIRGGMMKIPQEFWLWAGDPGWGVVPLGPATIRLAGQGAPGTGADLEFSPQPNGDVSWTAVGSSGSKKSGRISAATAAGSSIDPGWAMKFEIKIRESIPRAVHKVDYVRSKTQFGMQAPLSAIRVRSGDASIWLGMGERAFLEVGKRKILLAYGPERHVLPFALRLQRFELKHYEGTRSPASYSSVVDVIDGPERSRSGVVISMNEPLTHQGITFYQASYEDASPRPTVSIFSVNRDPGRWLKYLGSLLIVLGSVLLFYNRLKKKSASVSPLAPGGVVT